MFGINKDLSIHFIGIGGIGMSGIAKILLSQGYQVSGSDINQSPTVESLIADGAKVFIGHKAENIENVQLVVYSSAIDQKNPEIKKAIQLKLPIIKRAEMLAELMRLKFGIAVAGSHGKTTTTSLLSTIFSHAGFEPTCVVGGIVKNFAGQAITGKGKYLIAEADESDGSFLFLNPIMSAITNIDNDHMDYYHSDEAIFSAFEDFSNKVPFYGTVAINLNDPKSSQLIEKIRRPYVTYAIDDGKVTADFLATEVNFSSEGSEFYCSHDGQKTKMKLCLAGKHNISNALAATCIAFKAGISLEKIAQGLATFSGVGRRFETLRVFDQLTVVDDYGHHPTEINATIDTMKKSFPGYKYICIFQPHRYSRTKEFWKEFCNCFKSVDEVYIAPIYAASEEPIEYIDSEIMVKNINDDQGRAFYLPTWQEVSQLISVNQSKKTILLSFGAGSISREMRRIVNAK